MTPSSDAFLSLWPLSPSRATPRHASPSCTHPHAHVSFVVGAAGGQADYVPLGGPPIAGDEAAKDEARAMIAAFVPTAGEGHEPAPAPAMAAMAAAAGTEAPAENMPAPFN